MQPVDCWQRAIFSGGKPEITFAILGHGAAEPGRKLRVTAMAGA